MLRRSVSTALLLAGLIAVSVSTAPAQAADPPPLWDGFVVATAAHGSDGRWYQCPSGKAVALPKPMCVTDKLSQSFDERPSPVAKSPQQLLDGVARPAPGTRWVVVGVSPHYVGRHTEISRESLILNYRVVVDEAVGAMDGWRCSGDSGCRSTRSR